MVPILEEAKAGQRTVFFVDAAHFVFGSFLGYLWCFVRLFVPTPSGRQRFNVLAAMNAVTHEIVKVTNCTYINALSVQELLKKIAACNWGAPITLVLDNARYQRCKCVQNLAEALHIHLLFLPSYSPNLNLIERFWKFVKKTCLYSQTYETFDDFCNGIDQTIVNAFIDHSDELNSLLTFNFQSFSKLQKSGQILRR